MVLNKSKIMQEIKEHDLEMIRAYMPTGAIKKVANDCSITPAAVSQVLKGVFHNHKVLLQCTKIALDNKIILDQTIKNLQELSK